MPILDWIGKSKVSNYHFDVPYYTLRQIKKLGVKDDSHSKKNNMIIEGDNLLALKSLLPKYESQVDCIYIDPPYNTGNEKWVYNDNVSDPRLQKWLGEVVGKEGDDLSRHDKWLCMMYPRLKILRKLLKKNGVIFISIDDNEFANLKLICDEIFGYSNGLGPIIQNKNNTKNDTHNIQKNHDYILAYRKTNTFGNNDQILSADTSIHRSVLFDGTRYFYLSDPITTRGEGGVLRARKNLGYTFYLNPITLKFKAVMDYDQKLALVSDEENKVYSTDMSLINQGYTKVIRPPMVRQHLGAWTWELDKAIDNAKDLYFKEKRDGTYSVHSKRYVETSSVYEENGKFFFDSISKGPAPSIINFSTTEGTKDLKKILGTGKFENPKNVNMIQYLINLIDKPDALILDAFAGSGTTAEAVLNLNKLDGGNRHFILIELEDYVRSITAERIKRVIQGYTTQLNYTKTIYQHKFSISDLRQGFKILDKADDIVKKESKNFDSVKREFKNNILYVRGTYKKGHSVPGTGGSFDYYVVDKPLFDNKGNIAEGISVNEIGQYIWYTETNSPIPKANYYAENGYLGQFSGAAYYLLYQAEKVTSLNEEFLKSVDIHADSYVIYADKSTISEQRLEQFHIVFKKIPRDISHF